MSGPGLMPAWTANVLRCTATPRPPGTVVHAREGVRPRQHRPPPHGFTHPLTMVDWTTRWPEVVLLSSTTSAEVARVLIATWDTRFGTPSDLSSDRGPQFTSELWNTVVGSVGVKVHRTTAYYPQANGLCECFLRSMKAAL